MLKLRQSNCLPLLALCLLCLAQAAHGDVSTGPPTELQKLLNEAVDQRMLDVKDRQKALLSVSQELGQHLLEARRKYLADVRDIIPKFWSAKTDEERFSHDAALKKWLLGADEGQLDMLAPYRSYLETIFMLQGETAPRSVLIAPQPPIYVDAQLWSTTPSDARLTAIQAAMDAESQGNYSRAADIILREMRATEEETVMAKDEVLELLLLARRSSPALQDTEFLMQLHRAFARKHYRNPSDIAFVDRSYATYLQSKNRLTDAKKVWEEASGYEMPPSAAHGNIGPYRKDMLMRIAQEWHPELATALIVLVQISPEGKVMSSSIFASSGDKQLDDQAMTALNKTVFAPLPNWYHGSSLQFKVDLSKVTGESPKPYPGPKGRVH